MHLSEATVPDLPTTVTRPTYDRRRVIPAIVHLGLGAFHRAHQAVYTDAVLASGDLEWGIVAAGLVSGRVKAALAPQDGLYTLAEMSAAGERLQVIGAIVEVLGADDLATVLVRMAAPTTRIVSLTVTEKGYYIDPASGALQREAPAIVADLAAPRTPKTILGLIVEALRLRRAAGIAPFTVLSCDNLPHNGRRAKAAVVAFARALDAGLADWIEAEVAFPCTMVDRITPATTDADVAHVAAALGMDDAGPVVAEEFTQWVIEDDFTLGRPDWTLGGAVFSNEIERWEDMKLRCLNGAHSTLAYLGQLSGRETVAEAMQSEFIVGVLDALWPEVCAVLDAPAGVDPADYVASLRRRFCNPALKHRTLQIAMDGSQKLPQRLLAPLRARLARGLPVPALATAVAGWMHFVVKVARTPGAELNDPLAIELLARARRSSQPAEVVGHLLACEAVFGRDLAADIAFRRLLEEKFIELGRRADLACAVRPAA